MLSVHFIWGGGQKHALSPYHFCGGRYMYPRPTRSDAPEPICTIFGELVDLTDVVTPVKFGSKIFIGFPGRWVENRIFPLESKRPIKQCHALPHALSLRYFNDWTHSVGTVVNRPTISLPFLAWTRKPLNGVTPVSSWINTERLHKIVY